MGRVSWFGWGYFLGGFLGKGGGMNFNRVWRNWITVRTEVILVVVVC